MTTEINPNEATQYFGEFRYKVDQSHRVMLPSEWRQEGAPVLFTITPWPLDRKEYLLVLPPARWSVFMENLRKQSLSNESVAIAERLISSRSRRVSLDRFGRLHLPPELVKVIGIERDAQLVGRLDKFEVWHPDNYAAAQRDAEKAAAEIIRSITV